MAIILIRTIILYFVVLFVLRVMGKGELSKMDPFQMVILFMIAELASLPIESPSVSVVSGITALVSLLFLQVLFSFISMKSEKFKRLINGTPSVLIDKGTIDVRELNRLRISINDLTEQLRLKNVASIADLDYAIMEVNGDLTVVPCADKKPLTPSDMSISKTPELLPVVLISDGALYKRNVSTVHFDENQLKSELLAYGITSYKEVFLCYTDELQKLHVYKKGTADGKGGISECVR